MTWAKNRLNWNRNYTIESENELLVTSAMEMLGIPGRFLQLFIWLQCNYSVSMNAVISIWIGQLQIVWFFVRRPFQKNSTLRILRRLRNDSILSSNEISLIICALVKYAMCIGSNCCATDFVEIRQSELSRIEWIDHVPRNSWKHFYRTWHLIVQCPLTKGVLWETMLQSKTKSGRLAWNSFCVRCDMHK